jgi:regulator of sigma E protease
VLTTLASFVFVLGVLVFVHELGHYLAAKRIGVRVLTFSLGFGPKVVGVRYGDTDYCISAIPLGGYVKMAGENADDARTGAADELMSKTKWERFQVMVMGPAMNLALAVVLTAVVLYQGALVPAFESAPPIVGVVTAGSPAERADVQPGDRITSVADRGTATWEQFYIAVGSRPNQEISIRLLRNGLELTRKVTPVAPASQSRFEIGDIGVLPDVHPRVPSVSAGGAAERAGIKPGDIVLAVNGQPIVFASHLKEAISKRPDQEITISVLRAGTRLEIQARPERRGEIGWLGVGIADETRSIKPGAIEAVGLSVKRNVQFSGLIFQTIWGLVTRETSPRQLMGPVAIAQLSGESAHLGWIALLSLMASISLNLGLLNLLPIPVLDGGHIFIMAIEGLVRRDFSLRVKEKVLLAGFVALMMLMVTVIYNDLMRIGWIERLMPWR